jgi:hypothetical protein
MEEFVARVFTRGKVTVSKRLRELFGVEDGDYVRLALVEVLKKGDDGWVKRKVEWLSALKYGFFRAGFTLCEPSGNSAIVVFPIMVTFACASRL